MIFTPRLLHVGPIVIATYLAVTPQASSLRGVMARAGEYAVAYGDALTSVIAEEHFVQERLAKDATVVERRRLESEIAFVTVGSEWLAFRSVLRVDGAAVAGDANLLERVFRETPSSALARARAISRESARHNLGPVQRTFNVPTTVLHFLLPQHQERFQFRKSAEERLGGDFVWVVSFRERDRGTFIRTPQGRRAPAEGRLWIVPGDGRIVRSVLTVKADVNAEIDVEWRHDERVQLWVPAEMRERYSGRTGAEEADSGRGDEPFELRGNATYSNYRRFQVDVRIIR